MSNCPSLRWIFVFERLQLDGLTELRRHLQVTLTLSLPATTVFLPPPSHLDHWLDDGTTKHSNSRHLLLIIYHFSLLSPPPPLLLSATRSQTSLLNPTAQQQPAYQLVGPPDQQHRHTHSSKHTHVFFPPIPICVISLSILMEAAGRLYHDLPHGFVPTAISDRQ